jgi:L-iditol 2-dehydrogenase
VSGTQRIADDTTVTTTRRALVRNDPPRVVIEERQVTKPGPRGARTLVVEPSRERREMSVDRLGADVALDPLDEEDLGSAAARLLGGRSPDLVIEAAGASGALASALELAGENGRVLFLGHYGDEVVPARLGLIQERNLRVVGSTGAPPEIWPRALRFLEQAKLDLSPLVSARYPLVRAAEAFEAARDVRTNLKVHLQVAQ